MAAEQRRGRATYDDVRNAPPHKVAEILDGQLVLSPRPAPPHARATSRLGGLFFGFDGVEGRGGRGDGPGGWLILDEPELHFGDDVLVPDVAAWRRERMPTLPDEAWFTVAPDWVCEVASPSTCRYDRVQKSAIYAREGVRWMWIVDPLARSLEVFCRPPQSSAAVDPAVGDGQQPRGLWLLVEAWGDDGEAEPPTIRPEPFSALPFELDVLWR